MSRLLTTAACITALFAAAATPALAQHQTESRVVSYADLDLYDPADADTMITRIRRAADAVCGERSSREPIAIQTDNANCSFETVEWAIDDFGHPMVRGRYYGYTPEVVVEGSWDGDDGYYEVKPKY